MNIKPVAETERLLFREFSPDEAEAFYHLNDDPEVIKYTGDPPFRDVAEARQFLLNYDHYAQRGFGRWSVYWKESGMYAGFCGLKYSPASGEVDVGFRFYRKYWNRGLATEAALAALQLGFEKHHLQKIVGRAMKENHASHRVLEKLGMKRAKEFMEDGNVWVQYEITTEEFFEK